MFKIVGTGIILHQSLGKMFISKVLLIVTFLTYFNFGRTIDSDDCEVCIKYLTRFQKILEDENISAEPDIKERLRKECKKAKGKDNRFCYYIGGTEDAATGLIGEVTKPCSFHMPPDKICGKLKKKDAQICELRYEKQIDWKTVDFNKMRVKQLKKILMDWGEECKGCLEKQEFIKRIKDLLPQYVREEL